MISEHPAEFDDSSISDSEISTTFTSFSELAKTIESPDVVHQHKAYREKWRTSNRKRASAAMEFLFNSNNKNTKTHFAYFGRSKSSVLLNAIKQVLQKRSRTSFLNKNLPTSIDHSEKFIYFPLGVDEEHSFLITAPYYTNQIETIRHVAKSIPINYKLYVKEHPSSVTRNWKSVSDYKEIMNNFKIYVYPRKIRLKRDMKLLMSNNIEMIEAPLIDLSSTNIRNIINDKNYAKQFISDSIYKYITTNNLYSSNKVL